MSEVAPSFLASAQNTLNQVVESKLFMAAFAGLVIMVGLGISVDACGPPEDAPTELTP